MGLMETGMAWFWPDKRMARWSVVAGTGMEPVHSLQANQTGVLLIGVHFLTSEIGARMFGMQAPGIGVYRPNDNPVIDLIQTNGRMRSNKSMIDRKDLKGMIRALKSGEVVWYAPITTTARNPAYLFRSLPLKRRPPPRAPDAGTHVQSRHRPFCSAPQTGWFGLRIDYAGARTGASTG